MRYLDADYAWLEWCGLHLPRRPHGLDCYLCLPVRGMWFDLKDRDLSPGIYCAS